MNAIYKKLISTYDVDILVSDDFKLRCRIEIFKQDATYCAHLLTYEYFRIQPSFPQKNGHPDSDLLSDAKFLILGGPGDFMINDLISTSEEECLKLVNESIFAFFNRS